MGRFGNMPPVVKNLLIINVLVLFIDWVAERSLGISFVKNFALFYPGSEYFKPHQFITHMFMHAGIGHLFFNMFALWMFGKVLEGVWGGKRFLAYYLITGLGAAALHTFVNWIEFKNIENAVMAFSNTPSLDSFILFIKDNFPQYERVILNDPQYNQIIDTWASNPSGSFVVERATDYLNSITNEMMNIPTVGASGAVFGVLLAFGMLFPNTQLMLLFPPIPIKAKYFVLGYGILELYLAISQPGSNIAHFAHLGGMLFGFILLKYWSKKRSNFY